MANQKEFNRADGAGYDFIVETVLALDPQEPASRRAAVVRAQELARARSPDGARWRRQRLRRVAADASLSRDVSDIVQRRSPRRDPLRHGR